MGPQSKHSWWLDELSTAGPEHLDPDYVAGYDAKAQFDPTEDIEALQSLGLDASSSVIDIGSGTGVFALAAAETGAAVTAVDVSPAMVAAIEQRATDRSLDNLRVVEAGFLSQRDPGPYGFVFTRNALHQLPDFWKVVALRQMAGLLHPGGILRLRDIVFDFEPADIENHIDAWMGFAATDPAAGYTAPEFATHVRSEFSTFTWLLEPMLDHAGFDVIDREIRGSIYATYNCRRAEAEVEP